MKEGDYRKCPRGNDPVSCKIATCCVACDYYYEKEKEQHNMKYFIILQNTLGTVIVQEFNKEAEANACLATLCPPCLILCVSYGIQFKTSKVLAWEYDNGACSFQIKKKGAA